MIANAIFKLCDRKNLFLSSIYLRITIFCGVFDDYKQIASTAKEVTFPAYFFTSTVFTFFTSTYCTEAMYKTRNTGTGNKMQGMGGMLYSGECRQTFWGMLLNIPGNVAKHSGECRQHSGECSQNVLKHSGKCRQTFREM